MALRRKARKPAKHQLEKSSRLNALHIDQICRREGIEPDVLIDGLLLQYERFPPSMVGTYSSMRADYTHWTRIKARDCLQEETTVTGYIRDCYPNNFLLFRHKVDDILDVRKRYGTYGDKRLAPLDRRFDDGLERILIRRGEQVGLEDPEIRTIGERLASRMYELRKTAAPLEKSLEELAGECGLIAPANEPVASVGQIRSIDGKGNVRGQKYRGR